MAYKSYYTQIMWLFCKNRIDVPLLYHAITVAQIKSWSGIINFSQRTKIMVLQDVVSKYAVNFLFIDGDTHFFKNCDSIFLQISRGEIIFNKCENKLADNQGRINKKLKRFFTKQNCFSTILDQTIFFDLQLTICNTGTIGFNSKYKSILRKVAQLVAILYSLCSLFVMEQVAFNYYFQTVKKTYPIRKVHPPLLVI